MNTSTPTLRKTVLTLGLALGLIGMSVIGWPGAGAAGRAYSQPLGEPLSGGAWIGTAAGAAQVPPNFSAATGQIMTQDAGGNSLSVDATFSGLTGSAMGAHIHCCAAAGANAGVAVAFTGFPVATSGHYSWIFDLSFSPTYTPGFVSSHGGTAAGAQAALLAGLDASQAYADIHSSIFPGGEIRAQLVRCPDATINPTGRNFSAAGGSSTVDVTATSGCPWGAISHQHWITITGGASGNGSGTVGFMVAQNAGVARSGTITVAGKTFTVRQGANFADVDPNSVFFDFIGKLSAAGITVGCGQDAQFRPLYCPSQQVTREQMAAFIIRALGDFNPPPPVQQEFLDVFPASAFYAFIDQMAIRKITVGCDPAGTIYCPLQGVTREQMAAFLIRALGMPNPPFPAQQRFADVFPASAFYRFVDQMAVRAITVGCNPPSGNLYCPGDVVTREQMAAFLARAFGL